MKYVLAFFFMVFTSSFLFGKDTTHVTTYYRGGQLNERYILNSSHQKHGEYVRYTRYGKKYITGTYVNGLPAGTWNYYSSDTTGTLVQTLDFDNHRETFVDSLRVHTIICGPRYFGGNMLQYEYVSYHVKNDFTPEERAAHKGKTYTVSFTIDSVSMKPVMISVDNPDLPEPFRKKLETIVAGMPAWLPPVCKNKSEVWRFSVAMVF